jgi:hypothetical protein
MKEAKMKLDLENDTAEVFEKRVPLNFTSSGHYCIPISRVQECCSIEEVCMVDLSSCTVKKRKEMIVKLHRQFSHPSKEKFTRLLKDAGAWNENLETTLTEVYEQCQTCKMFAKTPPKPASSELTNGEQVQSGSNDGPKVLERELYPPHDRYLHSLHRVCLHRQEAA